MKKSKRDVLKGLAAGSVWSAPVVSSIVLPAHASTTMQGAPAGCYTAIPESEDISLSWPGGTGPHCVEVRSGLTCTGDLLDTEIYVAAETLSEAIELGGQLVEPTSSSSPVPFWFVDECEL